MLLFLLLQLLGEVIIQPVSAQLDPIWLLITYGIGLLLAAVYGAVFALLLVRSLLRRVKDTPPNLLPTTQR